MTPRSFKPQSGPIFINPGTEPLYDSDASFAESNMERLIEDAELTGAEIRRANSLDYDAAYEDGRYAFIVRLDGKEAEVQMPGLPIAEVRYKGKQFGQNIWDYPRLYVEGSSWVWPFAVKILHTALTDDDDFEWTPEP